MIRADGRIVAPGSLDPGVCLSSPIASLTPHPSRLSCLCLCHYYNRGRRRAGGERATKMNLENNCVRYWTSECPA